MLHTVGGQRWEQQCQGDDEDGEAGSESRQPNRGLFPGPDARIGPDEVCVGRSAMPPLWKNLRSTALHDLLVVCLSVSLAPFR
eukprot:6950663-Pyramimonas_sp.AAC.1